MTAPTSDLTGWRPSPFTGAGLTYDRFSTLRGQLGDAFEVIEVLRKHLTATA